MDSWHYKLLHKICGQKDMPKTLCGYFWIYVFTVVMCVAVLFSVGLLIHLFVIDPLAILIVFGSTGLALGLVFFISCIFDDKKHGVFISWLKAKKDKICPIIEYYRKEK
jgi:hypothetical protein